MLARATVLALLLAAPLAAVALVPSPGGGQDAVVATVPVGPYPTSTAVDPVLNRAYVGLAFSSVVSVVDTTTNQLVAQVPVGCGAPYGLGVDPVRHRVYVACSGYVGVIDGLTNTYVASWRTGTTNWDVAVDPRSGDLWVVDVSHGLLQHLRGTDGSAVATVNLGCCGGYGLALDLVRNKVFVGQFYPGASRLVVVNLLTHALEASAPVGNMPYSLDVDPVLGRVFVGNYYSSTMSVYDVQLGSVVNFLLRGAPSGVAVNPGQHEVFVTYAGLNLVSVLDTVSYGETSVLPLASAPQGPSVDPVKNRAYIALFNSHQLGVVE